MKTYEILGPGFRPHRIGLLGLIQIKTALEVLLESRGGQAKKWQLQPAIVIEQSFLGCLRKRPVGCDAGHPKVSPQPCGTKTRTSTRAGGNFASGSSPGMASVPMPRGVALREVIQLDLFTFCFFK